MKKRLLFAAVSVFSLLLSCNKDETLVLPTKYPPVITLDSPSGVYEVKAGRTLTIVPSVENGENAAYYWIIEEDTVCRQSVYEATFDSEQKVFVTLVVENSDGMDSEQMRIDVLALQPPVVSLPVPSQGLQALAGAAYVFEARVESSLTVESMLWTRNGEEVGSDLKYEFRSDTAGVFEMAFSATNEDGTASVLFEISVLETLPIKISFPVLSSHCDPNVRSTALGRSLYLNPIVENVSSPQYVWEVDGQTVCTDSAFVYTPSSTGETTVTLIVTERQDNDGIVGIKSALASVKVLCSEPSDVKRAAGPLSSALWSEVYEYTPAPGQFINESKSGYKGVSTVQQACDYADQRMRNERYVSLGAFGGYIIVGFDHSIENRGAYKGYDFSIKGNQFEGSSEPGIVWVMQDNNGNGLPDDEWYELAGSQTNVTRGYAVTYYRPMAPQAGVQWTDNAGGSGTVEYQPLFHIQDFYYPVWVEQDVYTLYGTRLEPNVYINPDNNQWVMGSYGTGYVDNFGDDMLSDDGNQEAGPAKTYFKIDNAVYPDGRSVKLDFIDFIKVQCGVLAQAGILGEVSTEVFGFQDENLGR